MSYKDRLGEVITLTSPGGTVHVAKWRGNNVSTEKAIGRFKYPNVSGEVVQDMGVKAFDWPITLYFDEDVGAGLGDHDKKALSFFNAIGEKNTRPADGRAIWKIEHPRWGVKNLQPIRFDLQDDPMESDGLIVVDTTWVEPSPVLLSQDADSSAAVLAEVQKTNQALTAQAEKEVKKDLQSDIAALIAAVESTIGQAKEVIKKASPEVLRIYDTIAALLDGKTIDVAALCGSVVALYQVAAPFIGSIDGQVSDYSKLIDKILTDVGMVPAGQDKQSSAAKNDIAIKEASAIAAFCGMAKTAVTVTPSTKAQAISIIEKLQDSFNLITSRLDGAQVLFDGVNIEKQYFSQSASYANCIVLLNSAINFMLSNIWKLSAVKSFTIDRTRATIEVSIEQYRSKSWNDDTWFHFFCATNRIYGDEILYYLLAVL